MKNRGVLISFERDQDMTDRDIGRRIITTLINSDSRLTPELVSSGEEKCTDAYENLDDFLNKWWAVEVKMYLNGILSGERYQGPFWRRKSNIKYYASVTHGLITRKGERTPSQLLLRLNWNKTVDYLKLFREFASILKPRIAMLHLFSENENIQISVKDRLFYSGAFGPRNNPIIPNVAWAMLFGKSDFHDINFDKIKAKGIIVEEYDTYYITRISENLHDILDEFNEFRIKREEFKCIVGADRFLT